MTVKSLPKEKTARADLISSLKTLGLNPHTIMSVLAVFVGLTAGLAAYGFRYLIEFFQSLAYGSGDELIDIIGAIPWYLRWGIPALGGLVVGPLVYFWAREAKGHGVPEVMEAVALRSGMIRKRIVVIKALASAVCIGTGGAVGREGPIVQIGSAIGSTIGQVFKVSGNRMRTLVGCGAAAGIAATFNAPIAGAMFSLEIILGDFALATFSPIVISSVTATAISRYLLGDTPAFIVPAYELVSAWEFPLYVTLGLLCAFTAVAFVVLLYRMEDLFDDFKFPGYLKPVIGGMILGLMALAFPQVLGVGYGTIDQAFSGGLSWQLMLFLVLCKIAATSITIGSGGSGGIFAPSLFMGAMAGGFFGGVVHTLFPASTASAGAYSIVGMGAVVSATTHGPITAILMIFEMTGDYKIILPLMISCIISSLVAGQIKQESIYTMKLLRKGIDIREGKAIGVLKSILVKDVMNRNVRTVAQEMPMGALIDVISKSKYNSFPVLDSAGRLVGILSHNDYVEPAFNEHLKDLVVVRDISTLDVITVSVNETLDQALEKISLKDFAILPVVSDEDPSRLVGVLSRRDIMGAYQQALVKQSIFKE